MAPNKIKEKRVRARRAQAPAGAKQREPFDEKYFQQSAIALVRHIVREAFAPREKLTVNQWADRYRRLPDSSAEPGLWRTDRVPYVRGPMEAITDDETEVVVLMFASQLGKTEITLNTIGYHIHMDPGAMLLVMPTLELARDISKTRLAAMIRDTPELADRVLNAPRDVVSSEQKKRSTLLQRNFRGGSLAVTGSNSTASLSYRPVRIVLFEELDRIALTTRTEGDPVQLARVRTTTFWNRKIVMNSSPTDEDSSRIAKWYEAGSQEQYYLNCPSCGHAQVLDFDRIDFRTLKHQCERCQAWNPKSKWIERAGKWIAKVPEQRKIRSFQLSSLVSPWIGWSDLASEFQQATEEARAGDFEKLKVFVNTRLAKVWKVKGEQVPSAILFEARRQIYRAEVPDLVRYLTIGVDVQDNRLVYEVAGWAAGKRRSGIEYGTLWGDPSILGDECWQGLDRLLEREFNHEGGGTLKINRCMIDSGGHATEAVYKFTKARHPITACLKGVDGYNAPFVKAHTFTKQVRNVLWIISTNVGKEEIYSKLRLEDNGPGSYSWPQDISGAPIAGYDENYFIGLTCERKVTKHVKGFARYQWIKRVHDRNEPLDCAVLNLAALAISKVDLDAETASTKSSATKAQPATFGAVKGKTVVEVFNEAKNTPAARRYGAQNQGVKW